MADIYKPNLGDTVAKWNEPVGPYKCDESFNSETPVDGGNPTNYPTSINLQGEPDSREYNGPGSSNSDPVAGKPGSETPGGSPMNPGLRPHGQPYDGTTL